MLYAQTTAAEKRVALRSALAGDGILRMPGAISPLTALMIEQAGFEGSYISGGAFSAQQGLPDIGLTTLTEVARHAAEISRATSLPTFVDADTGFGEPMNAARTVQILEEAGVSALHLEDQVNPKRCGHLDGKEVVGVSDMVARIGAAARGRRDDNLVIAARTDARAMEGLDAAIDRARAYVDAGADLIFPEALRDLAEFEAFATAVDVPILANMTEFGQSELFTARQLEDAGVKLAIYPVTLLRLAMGAVERGLAELAAAGTQAGVVDDMQTRKRLYEVIDYSAYAEFDQNIFTFRV